VASIDWYRIPVSRYAQTHAARLFCHSAASIPLYAKLCTVDVARIGSGLNSILRAARRMSAFTKPWLISPDRNAQLLQRIPLTSGADGQVFGVYATTGPPSDAYATS
jgi:hypothetical protein